MKSCSLVFAVLFSAQCSLAQQLSAPFFLNDPVIGPAGGTQNSPAVTWSGSDYFVVWSDNRDGRSFDLWFRRFDLTGAPLTPLALPLFRAAQQQRQPSAVSGNGEVLVAWLDDTTCASEVMARRFTAAGQPSGSLLALSSGACTAERPAIAWDAVSSQWLVVWGSHGAGREVHGAIVTAAGDEAVSDFVIATGVNDARTPWVTSPPLGAVRFQVAWTDDRVSAGVPNIHVATVSSTGTVGSTTRVATSASIQSAPCSAPFGFGSDVLIAWVEGTSVLAQPVTNTGVPTGGPMVVTTGPLLEVSCAEGPLGSVLVAYTDGRASGPGVFVRGVDASGVVSAEFEAAPRFVYWGRDTPRLAVNGNEALLVVRGPSGFVNDDDILARELSLDGGVGADAGVFLVSTAGTALSHVSAAFDGTRYLSAWRDDGQSGAGSDSFGQLVEPGTGRTLVDGGLRFTTNSANLLSYPGVAGSNSDAGFFVSWGDHGSAGQVFGLRVSEEGIQSSLTLLSDTSNYLSVHSSQWLVDGWATAMLKAGSLRLRRTGLSGTTMPETLLLTTGGTVDQLASAALGQSLLMVYLGRDAGHDVMGARFDANAGLLDPGGFAIAAQAGDEIDPSAGAGATLFLVAWSHGGDVLASRVNKQGVLLDNPPLALGTGVTPAVGWTGSTFLVVWRRDEDLVGARVTEAGLNLDATPFILAATAELDRAPHVASGAGEALVTWEAFNLPGGSFRAVGRFVGDTNLGVDAGDLDAGNDAGAADAGAFDAGATDAGAADAGAFDAGATDAGDFDRGQPDAGVGLPRSYAVGCGGCSQSQGLLLMLLLALFARLRTRRGSR